MTPERRARITWSPEPVAHGLPIWHCTIDPAWFEADPPGSEGWSLKCRFEAAPAEQGNPTLAWVAFLVEDAPHERLTPGARLRLFERNAAGSYAHVEVVEWEGRVLPPNGALQQTGELRTASPAARQWLASPAAELGR